MTSSNSFEVFKGGWDQLENAVFTDNEGSVNADSTSFFLKPDGRVAFVLHLLVVEEHPLTIPWDISTIQPAVNVFNITEDGNPLGLFFKDDGTKMFITGNGSRELFEYNLSSAWDISTAVFNNIKLDLSAIPGVDFASNCVFNTTGTLVFITTGQQLFSYILNDPWNAGSNTFTPTIFTPTPPIIVDCVAFKPEGEKMYIGHVAADVVHEFDLPSPFVIVGAVDTGKTLQLSSEAIVPKDIFWRSNGTQLFVLGTATQNIKKFHLESEWDISTASFFKNDFPLPLNNLPRSVHWQPDGLKMFELDSDADDITEYTATTRFNTSTLTAGSVFDVSNEQPSAQGFWWAAGGLKLFVVGNVKTVFEYTGTVPYSISDLGVNPTDSQVFVASGFGTPTGIFFSPDGLIMLVSSDNPENIHQWNLTAPFVLRDDLADADHTLDLSAGNIDPRDLFVKPDGLQMFLPSNVNDDVGRYLLTTPFSDPTNFDIRTAVFVDKLDIQPVIQNPQGISFNEDASQLFICDQALQIISTCDLSLEFNNSIITNLGEELITDTTTKDRLVYA